MSINLASSRISLLLIKLSQALCYYLLVKMHSYQAFGQNSREYISLFVQTCISSFLFVARVSNSAYVMINVISTLLPKPGKGGLTISNLGCIETAEVPTEACFGLSIADKIMR